MSTYIIHRLQNRAGRNKTTYVLEDLVLPAFEASAVAKESLYASCAEAEAKAATKSRAADLISYGCTATEAGGKKLLYNAPGRCSS